MSRQSDEILRLKNCPACGYALEGLPRQHSCPECEFEYDETMSLVYYWDEEEEPKIFNIFFNGIMFLSFLPFFLAILWAGPWSMGLKGLIAVLLFGGGTVGFLIEFINVLRNYRLRPEGRTADALVFTPLVYAKLCVGCGTWKTWRSISRIKMRRLRRGRWRLRLVRRGWRLVFGSAVKVYFKARPREAAAIRRRIRQYIDQARSPAISRNDRLGGLKE